MANSFCTNCGAALNEGQKFCQLCGAKAEEQAPVYQEPVAPVYQEPAPVYQAPAAPVYAEPQPQYTPQPQYAPQQAYAPQQPQYAPAPKVKPVKDTKPASLVGIIKRSVILALSLLMLIGIFLPVYNLKTESIASDDYIYVRISPADTIGLAFNAMMSKDYADVYDKMDELNEKYEDYYDAWEEKENRAKEEKFCEKYAKIALQSEEFPVSFAMVVTALIAVLYIVIAIIFFIKALIGFIGAFKGDDVSGFKKCLNLLSLQTALVVALAFACRHAYNELSYIFTSFDVKRGVVSGAAITMIILGVVALAAAAVYRIFFEEKAKVEKSAVIKRAVAFIFIIALMVSTTLPMFFVTSNMCGDEDKSTMAQVDADIFAGFVYTKEEREEIQDSFDYIPSSYKDEFAEGIVEEVFDSGDRWGFKTDEDGYASEVLTNLIMINGYNITEIFAFAGALPIFVVFFACLLLWQQGYSVATGEAASRGAVKTSKTFAIIMSAILVAIILLAVILVLPLTSELDSDYGFMVMISYGAILMLTFAIVVASIKTPVSAGKVKVQPQQQPVYGGYTPYQY